MNGNPTFSMKRLARLAFVALILLFVPGLCPTATAFPPAPYHLIYGLVRDRYGTPLTSAQAQIVLQTPSGVHISAPVLPGFGAGVNYQIKVPMDAGQTPDLYAPNALLAAAPFNIVVVIGTLTNIPIEMTGNFSALGQPGKSTRIDLTLGVDSNGDGIPDAWESAFLAALAMNIPLSSLHANSVLTPDGLTLRQQYLLGTYPFDPGDPCKITLMGFSSSGPVLQFPTITGRSYTVLGSSDLKHWSAVSFNLASDGQGGSTRTYYYALGIATIQVHLVPPPPGTTKQFYRIQVQ